MFLRRIDSPVEAKSPVKKQEMILVIGGPGSGKGTQAKILSESNGYRHISTGDLVRKMLNTEIQDEKDRPRINKIRERVNKGELLDDLEIFDILKQEINNYPDSPGFIIDGYPRTLKQAQLFEEKIQPFDKIIYFKLSEKIMHDRMLQRGEIEHRQDDNETTILHRVNVYKDQSLPVVQYFETHRKDFFTEIDASGSIESVAKQVRHAIANDTITSVNMIEFLKLYFSMGNFYKAIDALEKKYGTTNFEIGFTFATLFYVLQNKNYVQKLLTANTALGYQYNNFNVANGHHDLNILANNAFMNGGSSDKNPIWKAIHTSLAQSVGDRKEVNQLIDKHINTLFSKMVFDLDVALEQFMLDFWCDYLFGPKINTQAYAKTREKLLAAIRYSYYDNQLKTLPYIGNLSCRFYGYLQGEQFKQIDKELATFIRECDGGLIYRFREALRSLKSFPQDQVDKTVLDNTFDFVLVFDFIHNAMYESLVAAIKNGLDDAEQRKQIYSNGLRNAFLFPFRSRITQEGITLGGKTIAKGSTVYLNLLESKFTHSYGPRSCIGTGVAHWIEEAIWRQLENKKLHILKTTKIPEREKLSHSLDVPISPERYEVSWQYGRDYLQKILPFYAFKGVSHFYDVLKIHENPELTSYIASSFIKHIEDLKLDGKEKMNLAIAVPELRGVPIASIIHERLGIPLYIIRKQGKTPGPIFSKQYNTAYSSDTLEISADSDLRGKNIVLIDDGIASGGTTLACCELLEAAGAKVQGIFAIINHTYATKEPGLEKYNIKTLFDFENKGVRLVNNNQDDEQPKNQSKRSKVGAR